MSSDATATASAEERQLAVEITAAVLEEAAPDEACELDEPSVEVFADPFRAVQPEDPEDTDDRPAEPAWLTSHVLAVAARLVLAARPGGRQGGGGSHALHGGPDLGPPPASY